MSKDEQFMGFGKAVIMRMLEQRRDGWIDFNVDMPEEIEEYSAIVGKAAYDLVAHTLWNTASLDLERLSIAENVERIPDMPVLPEEEAE